MIDPISSEITIAITVYDRRDYIIKAVESALNQTIPVSVIVVEDCGPDPGLQAMVKQRFGDRVRYYRNTKRRGLFDNWNACIEKCETAYLSILHDDDLLYPEFVSAMKELMRRVPNCGLYFGTVDVVDEAGKLVRSAKPVLEGQWRMVPLEEFARRNPVIFPGQMFKVAAASQLGGFRATSQFCGDYEMWANLTANSGAAQTARLVAANRTHSGTTRGTTRIERAGKVHALSYVQMKRVAAALRAQGNDFKLSRKEFAREFPVPTRDLLQNAALFTPRMLRYNYQLLLTSQAPHWEYACFQYLARLLGPSSLKWLSKGYRAMKDR